MQTKTLLVAAASAAALTLPGIAAAQVSGGVTGTLDTGVQVSPPVQTPPNPPIEPTMNQVEQTVQDAQDTADPTLQDTQDTVDRTLQDTQETADDAVEDAQDAAEDATEAAADASAAASAQAEAGPVTAATAVDLRAGAAVRDTEGGMVGTIESADAASAVVATGNVRARLPLASFGKNDHGLVIAMTRTELEAAANARTSTPTSS